jgi:hypothetical protein
VRWRWLESGDVPSFFPHWNNYRLKQFLRTPLLNSTDDMRDYIQSANEGFSKRKGFTFGIESLQDNKLVGIGSSIQNKL